VSETVELDASLRELWRRKWLVLLGAAAVAAVTAVASMLTPVRYQTTALVQVGRVMGEDVENPYAVAETIKSPGFQAAAHARSNVPMQGRVSADALTGGQGRGEHPVLVRVTASGGTPEAAVAAGQAALDELLARHGERFAKAVAGYREYEKVLAAAAEPAAGQVDAIARRDLGELRARLTSPIVTAETRLVDPFPLPAAPVPRNTLVSAAVAFAVTAAVLSLLALALAQVRASGQWPVTSGPHSESRTEPHATGHGPRATGHGPPS
jgi:hypothetical protein